MVFTRRLSELADVSAAEKTATVRLTLALTAEERTRSRYRFETPKGRILILQLPRGTVLRDRDWLHSPTGEVLQILAKPEPLLRVTANTPLDLLRAAYHLGNRHVPLEVTSTYLHLSPDPVLKKMLEQLGVAVCEEVAPFHPEMGAYQHH
ncbi:urease accessory protein UreE [Lusitaniella coriacea LEGE 07157]|uniref:Urease accessory protein UreE n=1 Tax=Lusitaniella coriacea LEGE 07157 TaxID=945747 RepID=A0A8J7B8B2_9CYAN|nr:urease accessory protein UreE [Lusitaniella coriacea LEGE 07157]